MRDPDLFIVLFYFSFPQKLNNKACPHYTPLLRNKHITTSFNILQAPFQQTANSESSNQLGLMTPSNELQITPKNNALFLWKKRLQFCFQF